MPKLPAKSRFQKLVEDISQLYLKARGAQVQFAWETGRRIVEEEQNGDMRAQYGASLIPKLSETLSKKHGPGFSETNVCRMRKFYLLNQKKSPPTELDWTACVELLPVKDARVRKQLEARILKEGLKCKDIRREVRHLRLKNAQGRKDVRASACYQQAGPRQNEASAGKSTGIQVTSKSLTPLKRPTGLKLNTFSLAISNTPLKDGYVLIDCGFFVYRPVKKEKSEGLDLKEMSYTYKAFVERVVDGDTLLAMIETGLGTLVQERLRLRGIDCPELSTSEGARAKKFVDGLLPPGTAIVIKSHKCKKDIYGRFVADVFYREGVKGAAQILEDPVYLNQQLLDEGLAVNI